MRTRLILAGAGLLAFGASLAGSFHFDDYAIFTDPALQSAAGLLEIWKPARTRPLTYFTFWLNYQLGGQDPLGYHLLNLVLHLAAVLLVYDCLRRLVPEGIAAAAAALFAVHPLQAEAVNYVWARSILLAAVFCFLSLRSWLAGREWIAVAWFAAALLAKEECAAFPLVLLVIDRKRIGPIAAMLGLAGAAAARVIYATAITPGALAGSQAPISPAKYLVAQGPVILRYVRMLVLPYGFTVDPDLSVPPLWLGVAAWITVAGLVWAGLRYDRTGAGKWFAMALILLLPSSSLFPAADLAADRRVYLPMLGFATAAAMLLARIPWRFAPTVLVAALAVVSVVRTRVWMTEASLWREAVQRAPQKVRPKIQLARALPAAPALELLNQARDLAPNDPAIAAETGKILLGEHQPEAALTEFGRALALDPRDARNLNNRGVALAELGQTEAAREDFERAIRMDPSLAEARENLRKLPGR